MKEEIDIKYIISIAKKAGKATLDIYNQDFSYEDKVSNTFDEGTSPLTEADTASDKIIKSMIKEEYSDIPILSEEGKGISYEKRKEWKFFWMIDPLDGTKEFIKKNGEFTINIALIRDGKPILGVVYVPVKDIVYYGDKDGSFKQENEKDPVRLPINISEKRDKIMVVASKSHFNDETKEYIEGLGKEYNLVNAGSSIKLCLVAEGKADIYPRLGPTMEWDTAAAHAVCRYSGKKVLKYDDNVELEYNKKDLLNPWFVVR